MIPRGLPVLDPRLRCGSRLADAKPSARSSPSSTTSPWPTLLPTRHHPGHHSQPPPDLLAVNGFFAALAGYARHRPDTELALWWPQQRCRATWGRLIQPQGRCGSSTARSETGSLLAPQSMQSGASRTLR
jgi:hypothetical protein